jgi:hypothetical protein
VAAQLHVGQVDHEGHDPRAPEKLGTALDHTWGRVLKGAYMGGFYKPRRIL